MKKFFEKLKNSKVARIFTASFTAALIACLGCIGVFAEESSPDLASTLSTSFSSISTDIFTYIGIALPIALGVVAAVFGIKFAIRFFKSVTK